MVILTEKFINFYEVSQPHFFSVTLLIERRVYEMESKEFVIKCSFKKGVSQKGNEYEYLALKVTDTYEKRVFLEAAEKELLLNNLNKNLGSGLK